MFPYILRIVSIILQKKTPCIAYKLCKGRMYRGTTLFPITGTYLMRNEHESSWNTVTSSKQLRWEIQPPVSLQSSFQPMTASLLGEYEYLLTPSLPLNIPILLIFCKKVNRQRIISYFSFSLTMALFFSYYDFVFLFHVKRSHCLF